MPKPFTPEQEARIREIVRELLQSPALVETIRASLNQIGRRDLSIFSERELPPQILDELAKIGGATT
jgi:hypothetical protein